MRQFDVELSVNPSLEPGTQVYQTAAGKIKATLRDLAPLKRILAQNASYLRILFAAGGIIFVDSETDLDPDYLQETFRQALVQETFMPSIIIEVMAAERSANKALMMQTPG